MRSWRITKYDPSNRDENGFYTLVDEWISISEIGCAYEGKVLTIDEYLKVETAYAEAVIAFMECMKLEYLRVRSLETNYPNESCIIAPTGNMQRILTDIRDKQWIPKKDVPDLVRLILREQVWCKLGVMFKMYVHFGYDYYMYIGCRGKCNHAIEKTTKLGLFAEDFVSPYLKDFVYKWQVFVNRFIIRNKG